jgi:hypothetical protein
MTGVPGPRRAPRMRSRPTARADLAECLELLPPWLALDAPTCKALPSLWETLVDEVSLISGVLEDHALPLGQRIPAWGVTLALPTTMLQRLELVTAPAPYLPRRIYAALLDGSFVPMDDRALGEANARGELVLMVLHFSMRSRDLDDPYVHSVITTSNDAFRSLHAGLNPQAIYYESVAYNEPMLTTAGFRVRPYPDPAPIAHLAPELRPMLAGLTRDEAKNCLPGTTARQVFDHYPPLFRLSAMQRRLLRLALFSDDDESIMHSLEVSSHGLKKLWRGIYDRIEDALPGFFGEAAPEADGKRGPEKRRQVLAYVRQRAEELQPWVSASEPGRVQAPGGG